jgi:hypothetical protein
LKWATFFSWSDEQPTIVLKAKIRKVQKMTAYLILESPRTEFYENSGSSPTALEPAAIELMDTLRGVKYHAHFVRARRGRRELHIFFSPAAIEFMDTLRTL